MNSAGGYNTYVAGLVAIVLVTVLAWACIIYLSSRFGETRLTPPQKRLPNLITHACNKYDKIKAWSPYEVTGKAVLSWYDLPGNLMANGEVFESDSDSVAHKEYPFGTVIMFIRGDKIARGVVRDRGPWIAGRDFDVSPKIAEQLGMIKEGVVEVNYIVFDGKMEA